MSQKATRKRIFLEKHPKCCFCGGEKPATTEDHQPARTFFTDRKWPEGHIFPACSDCNSITRKDEHIMSFYVITGENAKKEDINRKIIAMRNNHPEILDEIKKMGIIKGSGPSGKESPIIQIPFDQIMPYARKVGAKLGLALYYKHSGRIFPKSGGIMVYLYTNYDEFYSSIPSEIESIKNKSEIKRGKEDLSTQFRYRYETTESADVCIFYAEFLDNLKLCILTSTEQSTLSTLSTHPKEDILTIF